MTPLGLLGILVAATVIALMVQRLLRRRLEVRLGQLATTWGMNYSPRDHLRLTAKISRSFPIPGAARINIGDVIYGLDADRYRYIFTAHYTIGAMQTKRRIARAGCFTEPKERDGVIELSPAILAPSELPLLEQYQRLGPRVGEAT
jgi:hypothetical protein